MIIEQHLLFDCQICVGILLVWNSAYDIKLEHHMPKANRINNFTVLGIFLITVVNVLVASFGPGGEAVSANETSNQLNITSDMINSTNTSFINTTAEVFMKGTTLLPSLQVF